MARVLLVVLALAFGTAASAAGLPFASGSLEKARAAAKQNGSHVLIFYTSAY